MYGCKPASIASMSYDNARLRESMETTPRRRPVHRVVGYSGVVVSDNTNVLEAAKQLRRKFVVPEFCTLTVALNWAT